MTAASFYWCPGNGEGTGGAGPLFSSSLLGEAHAEGEAAVGELLLQLLGGDLTEVADRRDLGLVHHRQIADQFDVSGAQGVLGTDREVERGDLLRQQRGALAVALDDQVAAGADLEIAAELEVLHERIQVLA